MDHHNGPRAKNYHTQLSDQLLAKTDVDAIAISIDCSAFSHGK